MYYKLVITSIISIISFIGIRIFGYNFDIHNIYLDSDKYQKMYQIIEKNSGFDKYCRKISPDVVKKFCKIAKIKSINIDNITDEQFDIIYKIYTEYLISKFEKIT